MVRLEERDFRALFECLRDVYAIQDLPAFPSQVIAALRKVVPSDHASYNGVDPLRRRNTLVSEPADAVDFPDSKAIFEQHIPEHPLIQYYRRTRDGTAHKISDFLTRGQFHRLGLYREFFRRTNVEHQIVTGVAFSRERPDFTERDRLLLNLLRPHLVQAYRNARALTRLRHELALMGRALEESGRGVILLARQGRVRFMTARARQWLAEYFAVRGRSARRLPEPLERWVRQQAVIPAAPAGVPPPRAPLVVEREGSWLEVRLLADAGKRLLLLEERETRMCPSTLERLGLTPREAEVLAWVAEGKTNEEAGAILGLSPRTVQKHLEHIYQKLGVESRTAAARALEAAREPATRGGP